MSVDAELVLFEPAKAESQVRSYQTKFEQLRAELEEPPDWVATFDQRLSRWVDYLDDLAEPPAVNPKLNSAVRNLRTDFLPGAVATENRATFWGKHSVLSTHVPEFLSEQSERAAELWYRLLGQDDVYEIELASGTYEFEPYKAGVLDPGERDELESELRAVLPETENLYDRLAEERPGLGYNLVIRPIELVYIFCVMGSKDTEWLLYRRH